MLRKLRAGQTVSSVVREEGWAAPVLEQMQTWYTFDYEDYMSDIRTIEAGDMLRYTMFAFAPKLGQPNLLHEQQMKQFGQRATCVAHC